jgi:hypothetical protein
LALKIIQICDTKFRLIAHIGEVFTGKLFSVPNNFITFVLVLIYGYPKVSKWLPKRLPKSSVLDIKKPVNSTITGFLAPPSGLEPETL